MSTDTEKWVAERTFYCVRLRARLAPETCLANQERAKKTGGPALWNAHQNILAESCVDCDQGQSVKDGMDMCPVCGGNKLAGMATCGRTSCKAAYARNTIRVAAKEVGGMEKTPTEAARCKRCGTEFEPYKRGALMVKSVCKDCLNKSISNNLAAKEVDPKEEAEEHLLLALEQYGLRKQLEEVAKREFRTPLQQAVKFIADGLRNDGERKKCEG